MTQPLPRRPRGSALPAIVILLLLTAAATLAASERLTHQAGRRAETISTAALAEAKAALLGYAVRYPEAHPSEGPGYLPCPDSGNTGSAPGVACHVRDHGAFGRLPYRTLGLPALHDGYHQCLWYAVAGSFKHNPKPLTLNWDSPGQFKIVDSNGRPLTEPTHNAVAVILSPGPNLPGQARPTSPATQRCSGSASTAADLPAFLDRAYDTDIAGEITLIHGLPGSDVNDHLAWLTTDEIFAALRRRPDFPALLDSVLDTAATALAAQLNNPAFITTHTETNLANRAHGRLPDAAALGLAPAPTNDNWRDQLRFVACTDGSACLTVTLVDSTIATATPAATTETCRALILFGGERLRGNTPQHRRSAAERADPAQYLEGSNLTSFTDGTGDYTGYRHYAISNPQQPASEDIIRCVP
jgi:hypothetical protein